MLMVNFIWDINSNDKYISRLLNENRELSIREIVPNLLSDPDPFYDQFRVSNTEKFLEDNYSLTHLSNFAEWIFSHPEFNFKLLFHIYNPHHLEFQNQHNVFKAFKEFEADLNEELSFRGLPSNVEVTSFDEFVSRHSDAQYDPLVQAIQTSSFKNFINEVDLMYLIPLKYSKGPSMEINFDITPKRINENLEHLVDSNTKHKIYFHNNHFYTCPSNFCVDFGIIYINDPKNNFLNSLYNDISDKIENNQEWPLMMNGLLNQNFFENFGVINEDWTIYKNGQDLSDTLFHIEKVPAGGTWRRSTLADLIELSEPLDMGRLYDFAQIDPEFNPVF